MRSIDKKIPKKPKSSDYFKNNKNAAPLNNEIMIKEPDYIRNELKNICDKLMRNTSDLVNEMLEEAKRTFIVAIAVGFQTETKFVFSSGKFPLKDLNKLVSLGGSPVGLLRFEKENATIQGSFRPFLEYENEPWAGKYLSDLLDNTRDIILLSQQPDLTDY